MNAATLPYGYRADWVDNGERVELCAPPKDGYRLIVAYATVSKETPAWGTGPGEYVWRAYRADRTYGYVPAGDPRPADSFTSADEISAWLAAVTL